MTVLPRLLALVAGLVLAGFGAHVLAAQNATPPAAEPDVVIYVDAGRQELARAQVDAVIDPFEDASAATPADGARFVLVTITIENTGEAVLPFEPNTIILRDTDGFLYGPDNALQAELGGEGTPTASAGAAPLVGGELEVDGVRTGSLGYAVPENAELGEVLWVPQAGRLMILDRLGEAAAADAAAATPAATRTVRSITTQETATAAATNTPEPTDEAAEPTEEAAPTEAAEPTTAPDATTVDSDGDGLTDVEEIDIGSDPANADSDGDGLNDFEEFDLGTLIWTTDTDGDGLNDQDEVNLGTAPLVVDSDGDGLSDADEYLTYGTSPGVADSDLDGISDLDEINAGSDPVDPNSPSGAVEPTVAPTTAPTEPTVAPPPTGGDSDGDGLTDEQEASLGTSASAVDTDGDGLPDGDEVNVYGSNALSGDTDGDGVADLQEVIAGTDPTAP